MDKRFLFFSFLLLLCPASCALTITPSDWLYLRPIALFGQGSLEDFQVEVILDTESLIAAGKMRQDCGDAWFTDSDKVSLLPYWLESGCDTQGTVFWVKAPLLTFPKTIYVYYGRQGASSQSSGDDTFEFFDGFMGSSIDSSKWLGSGCATVSNGFLHLSRQGLGSCDLMKKGHIPSSGVLHLKGYRGDSESGGGPAFWTISDDDFGAFFQGADYRVDKWGFIEYRSMVGWEHDGDIDSEEHIYKTSYSEGTIYYSYIDSTLLVSDETYKPDPMSIGLVAGEQGEKSDSYFDYFFIRKFASPEPSSSAGPEESTKATTTTIALTTTTAAATTTTFPSDICASCCIAGDYSCRVSCQGSGINTISGAAPITECRYDGLTLVIKRGSNTQTSDCVNGVCAATTTTTSAPVSSTTTSLSTTTTSKVTTTTPSTTTIKPPTTTLTPTTSVSTTAGPVTTESPSSTYPATTTSAASTSTSSGPVTSYADSSTSAPESTKAASTTIVSTTFGVGTTTIITTRSVSTIYLEAVSTSMPSEEQEIEESSLSTFPDSIGEETTETDINESAYFDEWEKNISSMRKEPAETGNKMAVPALVAFLVIIAFMIMLLLSYYNKKHKHSGLIKQCEESLQKVESLKVLKVTIMHEYRTRMVTEEEARKIVLDCERDIVFEKEKLRRLLRKVGIKPEKLQGKEEIIGWIIEKLSLGEDPEILKKGLIGMNADPALVDDVKNSIK